MASEIIKERFWMKVDKENGPICPRRGRCWQWTASLYKLGYGQFPVSELSETLAHRVSYVLFVGAIPDELCVLHHCDNRRCVRPDHLFLGTHLDNMKDMITKGRQRAPGPICPARGDRNGTRTHPECVSRGEMLPQAKLTVEKVVKIRELFLLGYSLAEIGREYHVVRGTIRRVVLRESWKHV